MNVMISVNYKKVCYALYACIILFMPDFLRSLTTIYSISAESYVFRYPWLSYSFSFLEIPCILFVLFLKKHNSFIIDVRPLILFILFKEFLLIIHGKYSIFYYGDYSLILGLLVGAGCYYLLVNSCKFKEEDLLDFVIVLNFIFQILFVITGRVMSDGRYATLGSNVGEIGTFCSQYLLYFLFYRKKSKYSMLTIIASIGGLVISASRTNILLSFLFIIIFAFNIRKSIKNNPTKGMTIGFIVCLAILLIPFLGLLFEDNSFGFNTLIQRIQNAMQSFFSANTNYLNDDSSFADRLLSFTAGFGILSDNPFGISASAIDLQIKTIEHGYYYFPHSALLSYYLLWSFSVFYLVFLMLRLFFEAAKNKSNLSILILYIFVSFIIYGAPIINCKTYFWYLCIFSICKKELSVSSVLPWKIKLNKVISLE